MGDRWAIKYKRHTTEYKKELTKHAKSLKAYVKIAKDDTKDAMQKDQKCEQGSYLNRKETIYRKNRMKHEHDHGGQFNGISC
jgi:hypothetical protein